jgi:hypothetical protein
VIGPSAVRRRVDDIYYLMWRALSQETKKPLQQCDGRPEVVTLGDGFFADVDQVELKVDGGVAKFPIFYREARSFSAVLPANYFELKRMLPDPRFSPVQILPGVGAINLTAFEYYDTDVQRYNEFCIGIVINSPYYAPIPGYNLLRQFLGKMYSVYVQHLPVTTELALRAGRDFYNYPKFIADIVFDDNAGSVSCELLHEGERILTMSGNKLATAGLGEMKFMCNLYQYRQPQTAEFKLDVREGAIDWGPQNVEIDLNTGHPIGGEISRALLAPRAVMYMYMPAIRGILYGPDNISMALLRQTVLTGGFLPSGGTARKKPAKKKAAGGKQAKKSAGNPGKKPEKKSEGAGG